MCIYRNLNPSDCYKELNIDIHNHQTAIEEALHLLQPYNLSFIVQAGDSASIGTFQRNAGLEGKKLKETFYLPFTTKTKTLNPNQE